MSKNDLIRRRNKERQVWANAGADIAQQLMCDVAIIVLNEEFGFGYDRCRKFVNRVVEEYNDYHLALEGKKESDYKQEKLDRKLRRIIEDHEEFCPFDERYPDIKPITY